MEMVRDERERVRESESANERIEHRKRIPILNLGIPEVGITIRKYLPRERKYAIRDSKRNPQSGEASTCVLLVLSPGQQFVQGDKRGVFAVHHRKSMHIHRNRMILGKSWNIASERRGRSANRVEGGSRGRNEGHQKQDEWSDFCSSSCTRDSRESRRAW